MSEYILVHGISVAKDFTPETFGRLTSIGPSFILSTGPKRRRSFQVCRCSCGVESTYDVSCLRGGNAKSCGCYRKEVTAKSSRDRMFHGQCKSLTYGSWSAMMSRCHKANNKKYKDYGGRGITVCSRWREPNGQGFLNFLTDMGPRLDASLSIDRHPNKDGNYEPSNCRWATMEEQAMNRRNTVIFTIAGETLCLKQWAEKVNLSPDTITKRLRKGWSVEEAVLTPRRKARK